MKSKLALALPAVILASSLVGCGDNRVMSNPTDTVRGGAAAPYAAAPNVIGRNNDMTGDFNAVSPAPNTVGNDLRNAVGNVGDAVGNVGNAVKDAVENTGNAVRNATNGTVTPVR